MMVCAVSEHPLDRLEIPDIVIGDDARGCSDQLELEVRWMTSGGPICSWRASPKLSLAELKAQVLVCSGIPVEEQHLFWSNGDEFAGTVDAELQVDIANKLSEDGALLLVRCVSDPRITNLGSFRTDTNFPVLPSGCFRKVSKLSAGINGDIFLFDWDRDRSTESVAVKMLRKDGLDSFSGTETDERNVHMGTTSRTLPLAEDALTEIGILTHLSKQEDLPSSLLRMRGVFADGDFTWLVTEYAEGGELFQAVVDGPLLETKVKQHMSDLLQAVAYLHRHHIAHRDISLENILLKSGTVKLMDFGMAVRSHSTSGTPLRYFRAVGKDFFRAPECYVPRAEQVWVKAPPLAKRGDVIMVRVTWEGEDYLCDVRLPAHAVSEKKCKADVWGYLPNHADIWSVGVCFFTMSFQCPPWNSATLQDASFDYLNAVGDGSLEKMLINWGKSISSKEAMQVLQNLLRPDPRQRPSATECLAQTWFTMTGDVA
jgi:serine/threonine protein kinase